MLPGGDLRMLTDNHLMFKDVTLDVLQLGFDTFTRRLGET